MNIRPIVFSRVGLPSLLLLLGTGVVACSSSADEKKAAWSCTSSDVPMGEVVHCTQSALTMDGPATDGIPEGCMGTLDNPDLCPDSVITIGTPYECNAGEPECPPIDTSGSVGGGAGGTSGGTTDGTTDGTSDGTTGSTPGGQQSDQGGANPGKGGGGGNGNGNNGNGPKNGDFGSSGPSECSYVPDLPYCGGGSGGTSDGTTGGTTDGTSDGSTGGSSGGSSGSPNGNGKTPPGQEKKAGGSSSGGSSSGGTSDGGKGKHYKCVKDKDGNKSCESVPDCAVGTHPSACGACVPDGESGDCVPPSEGGCWVTGGGFIVGPNVTTGADADGHDNFGGNAKPMKDGRIQGHWNHVDHGTGNHAKGRPEYIVCRHVDEPGPGQPGGKKGFTMNQVYFGGPAEWRANDTWASGYWFDVVAKDHGEPGSKPHPKNGGMPDTYHFTIRLMDDPDKQVSGAIVYETKGELEGGNIQMHPPNNGHPYTPSSLPSWVAFEP